MPREGSTGASAPSTASKGSFDAELDAMFSAPPPAQKPLLHEHDDHAEHGEEDHVDEDDDDDEEGEDESIDDDKQEKSETLNQDANDEDNASSQEDGDWDEEKTAEMVLSGALDKKRKKKPTLEDENDTEEARNKRTIFLGNVPISAMTSRAVRKELQRHIVRVSPYPSCTEVVSLRFRSVSFRVPTSDMSGVSPGSAVGDKRRERARKFRELKGISEKEAPPPLTSEQKRKIAYINLDLNERADSVNAYVRLGDPSLVHKHKQASNALEEKLTGPILTTLLARALDNTLFHERHLRADVVQSLDMHEIVDAELDKVMLPDGTPLSHRSASTIDPKRTIFVGNLDFEAHEEEVRGLFEKLMREERGPPPEVTSHAVRLDGTPVHTEPLPGEWVQSVRIVRDKATQLGKGFAYVKFVDPLCVDEMVALAEAEEAFVAAGRPQISRQGEVRSAKKSISKKAKNSVDASSSISERCVCRDARPRPVMSASGGGPCRTHRRHPTSGPYRKAWLAPDRAELLLRMARLPRWRGPVEPKQRTWPHCPRSNAIWPRNQIPSARLDVCKRSMKRSKRTN